MNRTDAVALLSELFPGCFAVARPLKIGIAKDIIIKVNGTLSRTSWPMRCRLTPAAPPI
jgi:sRNA-binding protein